MEEEEEELERGGGVGERGGRRRRGWRGWRAAEEGSERRREGGGGGGGAGARRRGGEGGGRQMEECVVDEEGDRCERERGEIDLKKNRSRGREEWEVRTEIPKGMCVCVCRCVGCVFLCVRGVCVMCVCVEKAGLVTRSPISLTFSVSETEMIHHRLRHRAP